MPRKPPKSVYWDMYRKCWKKMREEGKRNAELLLAVSDCLRTQSETLQRLKEAWREDGSRSEGEEATEEDGE
jgi:hypothetical protein